MKQALISASVLSLAAGGALVGGVERSPQSTAILFQQGRYAELIVGYLSPDVSRTVGGVVDSGNITDPYFTGSISYRQDLTENIAIAFVLDEPIGTDIAYPTNNLYPLRGTTADLESYALTGYLKYRFPSNVSVFGGVRAQAASGNVTVRTPTPLPKQHIKGGCANEMEQLPSKMFRMRSHLSHQRRGDQRCPLCQHPRLWQGRGGKS